MRIVLGQEPAFYLPRCEVCHCPYFSKGYENGMLGWNVKTAFHSIGFDIKSFLSKYMSSQNKYTDSKWTE